MAVVLPRGVFFSCRSRLQPQLELIIGNPALHSLLPRAELSDKLFTSSGNSCQGRDLFPLAGPPRLLGAGLILLVLIEGEFCRMPDIRWMLAMFVAGLCSASGSPAEDGCSSSQFCSTITDRVDAAQLPEIGHMIGALAAVVLGTAACFSRKTAGLDYVFLSACGR